MNNQNQTSQAVVLQMKAADVMRSNFGQSSIDKIQDAIAHKYHAMETALQQITDPATPVWKMVKIAEEALAYDPLNS